MSAVEGGKSRFRTSFTAKQGTVPALFVEAKVVNVNYVTWTVDVYTSFDRKRYAHIQVGSPYLHHNNGEGFYVTPEVNAKCMVCIPGDSSPPHVAYFLMAFENVDLATADAPAGTTSHSDPNSKTSGASFAGGRQRAKPGDIRMQGRDGNFVVLHRGGVLQIGSSELAQRLFIPLSNTMVDISDNYYHHTQGGTEYWGILPSKSDGKSATEYFQSFRIFADDKFADVRIKCGKVTDPASTELNGGAYLGQVVYEVVVAPQGVDAETGAFHDVKKVTYRFTVDEKGNAILGTKEDLTIYGKKRLSMSSDGTIVLRSNTTIELSAHNSVSIDGGALTHIKGNIIKLGGGGKPVAHQGAMVRVIFPFTPTPGAIMGGPAAGAGLPTLPIPMSVDGFIVTGVPNILV
jgi:hypothetical protein